MRKITKTHDAQQNKERLGAVTHASPVGLNPEHLQSSRRSFLPGLSNIIHLHYVGFRHQANGSLHFSYPPAISIVFLAKNVNHITTFK